MVSKVMAVVVALLLLGGATQAASLHASTSTCAVELDTSRDFGDLAVPTEPVQTVAPIRQTLTIVMPSLDQPVVSAFAPRTFRPPRG